MGGTQIGGGIAGVASEAKVPSIMIYNERKKYNEWEFVYDRNKDRALAGFTPGGTPGTPAQQMGNMPPGMNPLQPGQPGGNFGVTGGLVQSPSGFGQSSPGFGQTSPQQQPTATPSPQN